MKHRYYFILLLVLCFPKYGFTQSKLPERNGTMIPRLLGDMATDIGTGNEKYRAVKYEDLDSYTPKVIGTYYLTEDWGKGTLYLTMNRLLETDFLKYDIENNFFLINSFGDKNPTPEQIRVIHHHQVNAFEIKDAIFGPRYFMNAINNRFTSNGEPLNGFLEIILADEKLSLFRKVDTEFIRANYNVALNAGTKSDKIIKKETYFIKYPNSQDLLKITKRRKLNKALFRYHQDEMDEFMKSNNINFNSASDLIRLIKHYNSL